jgi:hypothetical protein
MDIGVVSKPLKSIRPKYLKPEFEYRSQILDGLK